MLCCTAVKPRCSRTSPDVLSSPASKENFWRELQVVALDKNWKAVPQREVFSV